MVGRGVRAKPVSAMGEFSVTWMVAGPVKDLSRKRCVWKIIGLLQMETTLDEILSTSRVLLGIS